MSKFNFSKIAKRAWEEARYIAEQTKAPVRSCLSEGFRKSWSYFKYQIDPPKPAVIIPRGERITPRQEAYILSLAKRAPDHVAARIIANLSIMTKRQASEAIDQLKALSGSATFDDRERYGDNFHRSFAGVCD